MPHSTPERYGVSFAELQITFYHDGLVISSRLIWHKYNDECSGLLFMSFQNSISFNKSECAVEFSLEETVVRVKRKVFYSVVD